MKTRLTRSQRKHQLKSARNRHAFAARMQPRHPAPQPRQESPALRSPAELICSNAEVADSAMNLIRSTVIDEAGSYLVMSIEVPVPFTVAYDAWTCFEDIPHFMRGSVGHCHDGSRMTWCIRTLVDQFAWQARVCEQLPFELISWKSVQGTPHPGFGSVVFEPITHLRTWVLVQVAFDMSGIHRWLGDPIPSVSRSLEQSLKRFHRSLPVCPADGEQPQTLYSAQLHP